MASPQYLSRQLPRGTFLARGSFIGLSGGRRMFQVLVSGGGSVRRLARVPWLPRHDRPICWMIARSTHPGMGPVATRVRLGAPLPWRVLSYQPCGWARGVVRSADLARGLPRTGRDVLSWSG